MLTRALKSISATILLLLLVIGPFSATLLSASDSFPMEARPASWQHDADLSDVFFLNSNLGWAVGSQGTILRTTNGGKEWLIAAQIDQVVATNQQSLDEKLRAMRGGSQNRSRGGLGMIAEPFKPYTCRFESIHFVDEMHGWVAGGYDVPYLDRSRAVILKTSDGGMTWRAVEGLVIPRIQKIHFDQQGNGYALGEMGNLFRTGIYFSSNGGETWSSQSSGAMQNWIDGQQTSTGFVAIDDSGRLGCIKNNQHEFSVVLSDIAPPIKSVQMIDASKGWAVGDAGTILQTDNGGLSWKPLVRTNATGNSGANLKSKQNPDASTALKQFDFETLAMTPEKIWVAGNPGSVVFSIDRRSGEVSASPTGIAQPILDLHFIDDQTGWAVGSLGTIVATIDGGQSWHLQRGKHRSVAVMGVAIESSQLPWELLATTAGEDNRICAAVTMSGKKLASNRAASERLGTATVINLGFANLAVAEQSNQPLDVQQQRLEKMVRTIRTLRPNVVVSNSRLMDVFRPNHDGIQVDLAAFLRQSIMAAADPSAFPEQLTLGRLQTWQVARLAVRDDNGDLNFSRQRMLPRTGSLIEDRIALSRALLALPLMEAANANSTSQESVSYRFEQISNGFHSESGDLFAGMNPATIPSRASEGGFRGNLNAIQLANSKQKKLDEFADFVVRNPQDFRVWYQQMLSWSLSLDENVAGIWLAQLSGRYIAVGQTEQAAATMEILATRLSQHPLAPAALYWLAQFYSSDELSQIAFAQQTLESPASQQNQSASRAGGQVEFGAPQSTMSTVQAGGVSQLVWTPNPTPVLKRKRPADADINFDGSLASGDGPSLEVELPAEPELPASRFALPVDNQNRDAFLATRWQLASQFLASLGARDPDLASGYRLRVLESSLNRKLSGTLAAEAILRQMLTNGAVPDSIAFGARRELQLAGLLPAETAEERIVCSRATTRPKLDGRLDDHVWREILQLKVDTAQNDATGVPSTGDDITMLAYDDEFLYLAFHCQKRADQFYQAEIGPRPRDADLSGRDRILFSIDVDRDYTWSEEFEVDHRGWVNERCGEATGWNPEWFVANASDERTWIVEIAIPLKELTSAQIKPETVWAIRLARMTSGLRNEWSPTGRVSGSERGHGFQMQTSVHSAEFDLLEFR